ncbi:MAG: RND family transporter [Gammaproteobacteria bacterium]|nr:RND family transporter [Gammaproteobacteria bacterium]
MTILPDFYRRWVIDRPWPIIVLLALSIGYFGWNAKEFRLDASADSLLLEDDKDLKVFRELSERYQSSGFLVVALTPRDTLFSRSTLDGVDQLAQELAEIDGIDSVNSLLDVPLLAQGEGSLTELASGYRTLRDTDVDLRKAREELVGSPIFSELVISADGAVTALRLNVRPAPEFEKLQSERRRLSMAIREGDSSTVTAVRFRQVSTAYQQVKDQTDRANHEMILNIRKTLEAHQALGRLMLGGVTMIADDMITFIKSDLVNFGAGVLVFLIVMLAVIFRSIRWVFLPLASCVYAGITMIGLLGVAGWQVTVISSNFISLMLILTMSMTVHLIVRYRQFASDHHDWSHRECLSATMAKMVWPCLYTALTTILAFGSLVLSSIKPVIDFGWMMSLGLVVTFLTSFLFFPAIASVLGTPRRPSLQAAPGTRMTGWLSRISAERGAWVISISLVAAALGGVGISRLEVENSFINYFGKDTEIYQGLELIDRKLGGTTPLDVLIKFESQNDLSETAEASGDSELDLLLGTVSEGDPVDYWFTPEKIKTVSDAHDFLASRYGVGQVLSLASLIRVGESVTRESFDSFQLAVLYKRMPEDLKQALLTPYVSIDTNEVRLTARVKDSLPDLRRADLLREISAGLEQELGLSPERVQISGLVVLYNNMLQSLFESQILSLGVVMLGIAAMLLVLFRSLKLAIIGIVPNLLAAAVILGVMGWAQIPLDMMTITIASITLGIAVDNSIHYLYRFRSELPRLQDYVSTLHYCHANIGRAIFYTAITIIVGFSILVLSNFLPTIFFGLLTALGMAIALLASLTLLPRLILITRPF